VKVPSSPKICEAFAYDEVGDAVAARTRQGATPVFRLRRTLFVTYRNGQRAIATPRNGAPRRLRASHLYWLGIPLADGDGCKLGHPRKPHSELVTLCGDDDTGHVTLRPVNVILV